ncbi:hypothetical protein COV20_00750 [Candidatus Woesearchaeota archaeon CG10_big_fil_rev_8_21_14_0_10_45_16]|nr:MAG: hypothetical protein COV20_00750 [Candidatus Woesearchaeota archaeon CG10_big_fil_rev_8_21_14_0_10_45_16]
MVDALERTVLLADDSDLLRRSYGRIISRYDAGINVTAVSTGEELVREAAGQQYNLIITDNNMGLGIKGVEAVQQIRAGKYNTETPLYVVSSDGFAKSEAAEAGATGFILKDGGLNDQIKVLLEKHLPFSRE